MRLAFMPIMGDEPGSVDRPDPFPMGLLEPHARQAQRNHSQSLQRLAERGGLSPCELAAILEDRDWHRMRQEEALEIVERHRRAGALTGTDKEDRE